MRYKRKERFKKLRHKRARGLLLLTVIVPSALVLAGYLLASVVILPSMS